MSRHPVTGPKHPLGLVFMSVLLVILALRAVGWVVIGGLLSGYLPGPARWFLSLFVAVAPLVAALGLLWLREWARWLTLAVYSVYFGLVLVNVVDLWPRLRASRVNLSLGVLNAVEAVLVLSLAWWYLNRRDVRRLFQKRL